ncbi:unnamed protein product [Didymodactylos carnosus]|uniref:Uncharacterized protein n=1 Tax=Didymodactylos carnosus TaxID=1234261 RepID=A0A814N1L1_9BILA|nr:unnamed protein product [Didymodactylos carnosus]CAF1478341.1 unnamed protein product [Didymodactylos carnosus]CAF3852555.1 unnamed protein product [Didymodactylos carnosus]CAF4269158.1 unnamed protein product [Didymodactylos carnosus]
MEQMMKSLTDAIRLLLPMNSSPSIQHQTITERTLASGKRLRPDTSPENNYFYMTNDIREAANKIAFVNQAKIIKQEKVRLWTARKNQHKTTFHRALRS